MTTLGIAFRASPGFVTDGAGYTYCLATDAYPTTRGGLTFGWVTNGGGSLDSRDRSTGVDVRLAGINFLGNTVVSAAQFRLDLPSSGAWDVHAAFGDASAAQTQYARLKDNATTFATISNVSSNAAEFVDASGVSRTAAAWPAGNVAVSRTFGSTIFLVDIGDPAHAAGFSTTLASLYLVSAAPPPPTAAYLYPVSDVDAGAWQARGPGLETVRNLFTFSESFDNAAWGVASGTITANATTDPLGGTSADAFVEDSTPSSTHFIQRAGMTQIISTDYVFSCYVKAAGRDWVALEVGGSHNRWFNVATGTVGSGLNTTGSIVSVGGGWYRIIMAFNAIFGGSPDRDITSAPSDGVDVSNGIGAVAFYAWGAQLEQASAVTAYQPILATTPPLAVTSTLYPALADGGTGTPDDATYAYVLAPGSTMKLALTPATDPADSGAGARKYHYRAWSPQSVSIQFDIYAGATFVATRTQVLSPAVTQYDVTLTGGEVALIQPNYPTLQAWVTGL